MTVIRTLLIKLVDLQEESNKLQKENNDLLKLMAKKMEVWFKDDVRQHEERLKKIEENKKDKILNAA